MRKHLLIRKKKEVLRDCPWYIKNTDELIANFSVRQLNLLKDILNESEDFREDCNPWYPLDVHRAVRKQIGDEHEIIVEIEGNKLKSVNENHIKNSACRSIFEQYKNKKATLKE